MGNFTISRLVGGTLLSVGLMLAFPGIASASSAATSASSAATSGPGVPITRSTVVSDGRAVVVAGSGLPSGRTGEIAQCSSAAPQPTVVVHGIPMPVSCTRPRRVRVGADGTLSSIRFRVVDGKVGPPGSGTDSWGKPAATDARRYPCAPTALQASAGAYCYLLLRWGAGAGDQTVQRLTFTVASGHSTAPSSAATVSPHVVAAMSVAPQAELGGGQAVVVTATGLPSGGVGEIRECNSALPQPAIWVAGVRTPVSCTDPRARRWVFTAQGTLNATFTTVTGTVGPPRFGVDSWGHLAAVNATRYPCPPTAAQVAAGAHCYLEIVWGAGVRHRVVVPITFTSSSSASATVTTKTVTASQTSTATAAGTSTPAASPSSGSSTSGTRGLPFTGASVEPMALAGLLLVLLGAGLLLVGGSSRRARRRAGHTGTPVDTR
ncbi:MAG: hypothetical protein ABSC41_19790 [Acidimicrobiales bacterium]